MLSKFFCSDCGTSFENEEAELVKCPHCGAIVQGEEAVNTLAFEPPHPWPEPPPKPEKEEEVCVGRLLQVPEKYANTVIKNCGDCPFHYFNDMEAAWMENSGETCWFIGALKSLDIPDKCPLPKATKRGVKD